METTKQNRTLRGWLLSLLPFDPRIFRVLEAKGVPRNSEISQIAKWFRSRRNEVQQLNYADEEMDVILAWLHWEEAAELHRSLQDRSFSKISTFKGIACPLSKVTAK